MVEDSDEDFEAFNNRVINAVGTIDLAIVRYLDGDDALDYVQQSKSGRPLPEGTVLDLNLSGTDGREVIAELKLDHELKMIPIVVLTPSSNSKDVETCYPSGVNSYRLKAMDIN